MKLTDETFNNMLDALEQNYLNWELPDESLTTWKKLLALSISEELLPKIILDWILNVKEPPKSATDIIRYGRDMYKKEVDSADVSAEILIDSARNAYTATDDFLVFADEYRDSFASALGRPAEEAYIAYKIKEHSVSPKVLIMVYDELKGEVQDCFTGDAENGVEFLRNHIKKSWTKRIDEAAKDFLISGNSIKRLGVTSMSDSNLMCYCDKCGRPITRQHNFEHMENNICPECAAKLYQKIFGNTEAEQ